MVYGIHKGVGWGFAYRAFVVQWYCCNRVSNVDGGGNKRMIDKCKKALERRNILYRPIAYLELEPGRSVVVGGPRPAGEAFLIIGRAPFLEPGSSLSVKRHDQRVAQFSRGEPRQK